MKPGHCKASAPYGLAKLIMSASNLPSAHDPKRWLSAMLRDSCCSNNESLLAIWHTKNSAAIIFKRLMKVARLGNSVLAWVNQAKVIMP
jgi:hypothetical protein